MSESLLIILIELVLVLMVGSGFLLFKAHQKKEAMRIQLKALLRKVENEALDRKEKLADTFKELGIADNHASQSAERLVDAEVSCVKKFAVAQLNRSSDDIAFFSDAVYDLSTVHMDVSMLNAESMSSVPIPVAPVVEPEQQIEPEIEVGKLDDDIEVSLDLDELEELADPESPTVESDDKVDSALAEIEAAADESDSEEVAPSIEGSKGVSGQ